MSRIVVIGATGHVGTYLVPRLVRAGHELVALSRGARDPYLPAPEWREVERVAVDRAAEDAAGAFGDRIAALTPDAVIDMLCFTRESAQQLVDALRPTRPLLLHCGSIWVHGPVSRVPSPKTNPEPPTASTEPAKQRSRRCCTAKRSPAEYQAWCDLVTWAECERRVGAEHASVTREHTSRSIAASIERARDVLGYRPRYSSLDALQESLHWLAANGQVELGEHAP